MYLVHRTEILSFHYGLFMSNNSYNMVKNSISFKKIINQQFVLMFKSDPGAVSGNQWIFLWTLEFQSA